MNTETHAELYDRLTAEGHDVSEWEDDPSLLRDYAKATGNE